MAERVTQNPHLEVMPDHAGPHYDTLQNALTNNGMLLEEAIQTLNDSWTRNHDNQVQRWDQRVTEDANAAGEAQRQQQQQEEQCRAQEQQDLENKCKETEKKRPKMNEFDDTAVVGSYIAPRPSQYALRCIEDFEYVKLWYFTPEGCADTSHHQHMQDDNTLSLTKVNNMVTLRSISAVKASKNIIPDAKLNF